MTGGTVIVLGDIGDNFGAGFTGGMVFVYDPEKKFELRVNRETVSWQRIATPYWEAELKSLIERHVVETESHYAATMLNDWTRELPHFWQVVPRDYVKYLISPLNEDAHQAAAITA
jgi:glutamate synthase (NADPH/NADH) large chain